MNYLTKFDFFSDLKEETTSDILMKLVERLSVCKIKAR
jgi:hypothetical protein